jgi:ATP-dependent DNA ligase
VIATACAVSRGGHDWAKHFPRIFESALKLQQQHFVIDGEAVVLRPDGISDFDALHSGKHTASGCGSMPSTCSPATARVTGGCRFLPADCRTRFATT